MPPPLLGRHDADHPAVATAPKSVRRSFACGTEPTDECGSVAPAPCEGEVIGGSIVGAGILLA
jgi:hypothetical protein